MYLNIDDVYFVNNHTHIYAYLVITANNSLESDTMCINVQIIAGEGNVADTSLLL